MKLFIEGRYVYTFATRVHLEMYLRAIDPSYSLNYEVV